MLGRSNKGIVVDLRHRTQLLHHRSSCRPESYHPPWLLGKKLGKLGKAEELGDLKSPPLALSLLYRPSQSANNPPTIFSNAWKGSWSCRELSRSRRDSVSLTKTHDSVSQVRIIETPSSIKVARVASPCRLPERQRGNWREHRELIMAGFSVWDSGVEAVYPDDMLTVRRHQRRASNMASIPSLALLVIHAMPCRFSRLSHLNPVSWR